ncbi:UNVERIFIED_CONTAM: hypothetical protein GTU68_063290 [Idotea baltica]|nr:hypothetical protein [Idotea baltica]
MDRSGADFFSVVNDVVEKLGTPAVALQVPIGSEDDFKGVVDLITGKAIVWNEDDMGMTFEEIEMPADLVDTVMERREILLEAIAEYDDSLMEKFFEDPNSITEQEMIDAIRAAVLDSKFVPMMCGSAFKNKGVQAVLDAVCSFLPSPMDIGGVEGTNPDTDEPVFRKADSNEPFSALAFKIATDPFVGRLAFMRVYSGALEGGSYVLNTRSGNKERISRLYQMHAKNQMKIDAVSAGDIVAAVGFKDIKTGDTLCALDAPIILESMDFPDPVISIAIEPITQKDLDKLGMALAKLAEEDPTFQVSFNEETGQTVIAGMGELHLEIIVDRLKREFKVECNQGAPQVNYREAITQNVEHREVYKKQSGGRGPALPDEETGEIELGIQFVNQIVGGSIPREFIPSIQKGFTESMKQGVLAGFEIPSMRVRLFDGSFHQVDSDAVAFELGAKMAYRNSVPKAKPVLLEPIMKVEILTPEEYTGDVVSDINRRRGIMEGMDMRNNAQVIKAKVPLSMMFGYVTALRTITSGRGTSTMEFSNYEQVPNNIAEEVIAKARGQVNVE